MKGKISLIAIGSIAATMLNLGIAQAQSAPTSALGYTDVKSTDADYNAIVWLSNNGVLKGYGDGTFRPNNPVNRAEMLKMIFVADGNAKNATAALATGQLFQDTPKTEWYAPYVALATQRGTIQGYPDGTFQPSSNTNNAEAYKIVLKEFFNPTTLSYTVSRGNLPNTGVAAPDVQKTDWFVNYVNFAALKNLYDGAIGSNVTPGVMFYPGQAITRGQLAELIYRAKAVSDNFPNNIQDPTSVYGTTTIPFSTNLYSYTFVESSGKPTFTINNPALSGGVLGYATKYPQSLLTANGSTPNTLNFYEGATPTKLDISVQIEQNASQLPISSFFAQSATTNLYKSSTSQENLLVNSLPAVWFHQVTGVSGSNKDEVVAVQYNNAIAIITDHGSLHQADGIFSYMVHNFWFKNFAV